MLSGNSFVVYYQIKFTGNTPWKKAKSNKPFNLRVLEYCTKFIFLSCVWSIRVQKLNKATKNLLFYSGVIDKIITLILKTCTKSKELLRAYCPNLYPVAVNPSRHASIYVVLAAFGEFLVGNIHFGTSMMMDQYSLQLWILSQKYCLRIFIQSSL